jgi:hypothetical protein
MKMKKLMLFVCLSIIAIYTYSQRSEYEVQTRMWKEKLMIPDSAFLEKWKGEPAVILHKSMAYEYKKLLAANSVNNDFYFRARILLLDKSSVDEYSEFSFGKLGYTRVAREGYYLGIKVIKPDGSERNINLNEAVKMQQFRDGKQSMPVDDYYKKLAIDDLEPGDIIDYYIVRLNTINTAYSEKKYYFEFEPEFMVLKEEYPLIDGRLSFLAERNCYINLSVSNGAPEPVKVVKSGKDYYEINYSNDESFRSELWTAPLRTEPSVKYQVIIPSIILGTGEKHFLGTAGVPKTKAEPFDYLSLLRFIINPSDNRTDLLVKGNRFIKKQRIDQNPETLINDLYFFYRNHLFFDFYYYYGMKFLNSDKYDDFDFIQAFSGVLSANKIEHEVFLGVNKTVGTIENALLLSEFKPGIRVNVNGKPTKIFMPDPHSIPGDTEFLLEGSNILKSHVVDKRKPVEIKIDSLPAGHHLENIQKDSLKVTFIDGEDEMLQIGHKISATGCLKDVIGQLVRIPEEYFKDETAVWSRMAKSVAAADTRKNVIMDQVDESKDKRKELHEEMLKVYIKESHGISEAKPQNFKVQNLGRWLESPVASFSFDFKTSELRKVAADYIIIDAGMLLGRNIDLDEKEKARTQDVYMSCPRTYEWYIELEIPEGYEASNLSQLNMSIENTTGGFSSEANISGDKVIINAVKYYAHNFEPLEKWPELLAMLELANSFVQQKLVFRKVEKCPSTRAQGPNVKSEK